MWPKTPFPARVSALMEQTDPAPDAPAARPQAPAPTVTVSTGRPFGSALARSQARAVSLLDNGGRGSSEGDKKYARRWTLGRTLRLAALVTFLAASGSVIALRWGRLPRKGAETRTTAARAVRGIQATQAADKVGFDAYFDAMNGNVDLYKQTEYPDTPTVLRAIRHHQMPRDCGKVRFLVFEL